MNVPSLNVKFVGIQFASMESLFKELLKTQLIRKVRRGATRRLPYVSRHALKLFAVSLSISLLAVSALAVKSPVGKWAGKLVDVAPGKTMNPTQGTMLLKTVKDIRVSITFKADKTYAVDTTHAGKTEHHFGKWSITGDKITLANEKGQPETGTFSKDSNTITVPLPAAAMFSGKLMLKRQ